MPDYLVRALEGVPTVGKLAEPNMEQIAAIKPELMLTSKVRHEQLEERLTAIAPTVYDESTGVVWKQNFASTSAIPARELQRHDPDRPRVPASAVAERRRLRVTQPEPGDARAVKRGAVLIVSDDVWMAGIGYRSAGVILDDLARYFRV